VNLDLRNIHEHSLVDVLLSIRIAAVHGQRRFKLQRSKFKASEKKISPAPSLQKSGKRLFTQTAIYIWNPAFKIALNPEITLNLEH
jgi:hypothetical protein